MKQKSSLELKYKIYGHFTVNSRIGSNYTLSKLYLLQFIVTVISAVDFGASAAGFFSLHHSHDHQIDESKKFHRTQICSHVMLLQQQKIL